MAKKQGDLNKIKRVSVTIQLSQEVYDRIVRCSKYVDLTIPVWCRAELAKLSEQILAPTEKLEERKRRDEQKAKEAAEARAAREAREAALEDERRAAREARRERQEAAERLKMEKMALRAPREQEAEIRRRKRHIIENDKEIKLANAVCVDHLKKNNLAEEFDDNPVTDGAQPRVNPFLFVEVPSPMDTLALPCDADIFKDVLMNLTAIENPYWYGVVERYYHGKVATQAEQPGVSLFERYREIFKPRYHIIKGHKILFRRWNPQWEKFLDANGIWEMIPRDPETNEMLYGPDGLEEILSHNRSVSLWTDAMVERRRDIKDGGLREQPVFEEPEEGWKVERVWE